MMSKKHVVIDARIIDTTTGRYCRGLLDGLDALGEGFDELRYTVLVPSKAVGGWRKLYDGRFDFVGCDVKNYSVAEQTKLLAVLRELKPDLVHFCMPQQPIFYSSSPVITTFHDLTLLKTYNSDKNWLVFHFKQIIGKMVFRRALKKSAAILTPSEYTREDILKTFGDVEERADAGSKEVVKPRSGQVVSEELAGKIFTVYLAGKLPKSPATGEGGSEGGLTNQAKCDTIEAASGEGNGLVVPEKYLLYVGNQADYKNIPRLMEAHQSLLKDFPNLYLVLASPPNKATSKNQEWAKKREYKNIIFTGWLANAKLAELYKKCACYCFPSLMEGFGLPALEAMGMGAPVVAANATCLPEIYGDAAIYFDPKDVSDMAGKIGRVLADAGLRTDLVKKGGVRFARYDWKKTAAGTLRQYRNVLK